MKCYFEDKDFRPLWKSLFPANAQDDPLDAWDDNAWLHSLTRIEAKDNTLTIRGPYKEFVIPARVERPGVLFVSTRQFSERYEDTFGETTLELKASHDRITNQYMVFLLQYWEFALFEDPATAPETWQPPDEPPDDADWFDDEPEASDAART